MCWKLFYENFPADWRNRMTEAEKQSTIDLLKECNAGAKMAVASMKEMVDRIHDGQMKEIVLCSMEEHQKIGDATHEDLLNMGEGDKAPQPMAKAMSWLKTNVMLTMDPSDHEVANLMIDGCNMGIKSISEYLNRYKKANQKVRNQVQDLIKIEKELVDKLQVYL